MNINFENKRILVTGAASGIGKGIATRLVQCGGTVIAVDRSEENLDKLKGEFPTVIPVAVDLGSWNEAQEKIKVVLPVDLLVNCAGLDIIQSVGDITEDAFDKIFNVNIKGLVAVTQIVVNDLIQRNTPGSIVNISSQASLSGLLYQSLYCASKGAVDAFTRALAMEVGPKKIRVNCVNPTIVMTELAIKAWSDPVRKQAVLDRIPLQRFAEIDEVVDVVLFLLSDRSSMVTGHCLAVDGGFLAA
ncbi:L-xylulose reductase-like [Sitophilus oryzae]|uniref:L-xylulose reductase-like n=1 Tax=Sitophilus oryzae TaxID=7048 RepID=A0A6J2YAK8_SITOR|nr:L-xylulose reductase-like [Sitophilus oryzae]